MPNTKISRLPGIEVVIKVAGILPLLVPNLTVESEEINPSLNILKKSVALQLQKN